MQTLHIVKIGGNIVNDEPQLDDFLQKFVKLDHPKMLVHGGGNSASDLCTKLNIPIKMNKGRRITDKAALDVAVMVYAGLINKSIVAKLQGLSCNSLGLSGADLNTIPAERRTSGEVDFGFVGDIEADSINKNTLRLLLAEQMVPVFSAITHNTKGQLLNTNADTIASTLAVALSKDYNVNLTYCFEKPGVLLDIDNDNSRIDRLTKKEFSDLKKKKIVNDGMIPKLETAFGALNQDVGRAHIKHAKNILNEIGTELKL